MKSPLMPTTLPIPDENAQQHSEKLLSRIKYLIGIAGGKINFADYMNLCLYYPNLGYYSVDSPKINYGGDFTTAPEISSLFSRAFAHHVMDVMKQLFNADILEFGAGSGKMVVDILLELDHLNSLPNNYFIIEVSANLRTRQRRLIEDAIPHLSHLIQWLDYLPTNLTGVILANEVCDAMPFHLLYFSDEHIEELYIKINSAGELQWYKNEILESELLIKAQKVQQIIGHQEYTTEINILSDLWLISIAELLDQGAIFIIDYGYSQNDYYHQERRLGTLMCYFQNRGHDNPLLFPGLQDITAHVNFSSLATVAYNHNLDIAGFQSQANFLISGDILKLETLRSHDPLRSIQQASEIKQLILPSEMGESFKVLTLTNNLKFLLPRIQFNDQSHRL